MVDQTETGDPPQYRKIKKGFKGAAMAAKLRRLAIRRKQKFKPKNLRKGQRNQKVEGADKTERRGKQPLR